MATKPQKIGAEPFWQQQKYINIAMAIVLVVGGLLIWFRAHRTMAYTKSFATIIAPEKFNGADEVPVPLAKVANFNDSTLENIAALRAQQAASARPLLSNDYAPTQAVFDRLNPQSAWMSDGELFYYGKNIPADHGDLGPTAASRLVLNPLLLVKADFWGLSIWGPENLQWNKKTSPLETLQKNEIPLSPRESELKYYPKKAAASVTYNVTDFMDQVRPYVTTPLDVTKIAFGLALQNAYDLDFRTVELDMRQSQNIKNKKRAGGPLPFQDFFGAITSAWDENLSLNSTSANIPNYDWIQVTSLPATAVVNLWHGTQNLSPQADFKFSIIVQ